MDESTKSAPPPSLDEVRAMQQQRFDEANRQAKAAEAAKPATDKRKDRQASDANLYTARLEKIQMGKGGGNRHPLRDGSGTASSSLGKSRQPRGG